MNIFTVLSQGKGRLNEENLSAMLGFLLSPSQTHGLGGIFLKQFLNVVAQECGDINRFDDILDTGKPLKADVILESAYSLNDHKKRVVDIEIRIYGDLPILDDPEIPELHRIVIENKIKVTSSDSQQLKEEFLAISQDIEGDETVKVTMVFLTPPGNFKNQTDEYQNLDDTILKTHKKAWLRWAEDKGSNHISSMLKKLLKRESEAEISPFHEYLRHTLKALIIHIEENINVSPINKRNPGKPGDITKTVFVKLSDFTYRIERYESTTVRIFNLDNQEYEVTKPILRKINNEKKLGIDLELSTGRKKNTRNLGRYVIKALLDQDKNLKEI